MPTVTYNGNGISCLEGTFDNVSTVAINLGGTAGVNTWKIYLNLLPASDGTILYGALYDASNGGGTRMNNIDSTCMSLYNNDIGSIDSNRNYIRFIFYGVGNLFYEGLGLSFELHNCNLSYTERDTTTNRLEMTKSVRGTWLCGKQYTSNYQMTDVGSFMGTNTYSSSQVPTGVESVVFYMSSGNMTGTYKAFPLLGD